MKKSKISFWAAISIFVIVCALIILNWHAIWHDWHWNKDNYINGSVAFGTIILAIVTVRLNVNSKAQAEQAVRLSTFNTWYQITESAINRVLPHLEQHNNINWGMTYTNIVTYKECLERCELDHQDKETLKELFWCALGPHFWGEYTSGQGLKNHAQDNRENLRTYKSFFETVGEFFYLTATNHGKVFDLTNSEFNDA